MSIEVRTSPAAIARSKATVLCIAFIVVMAPLAWMFLAARSGNGGVLDTLFTFAGVLPLVGIAIAVISWIVLTIKRRKPVLKIDEHVRILHSGVRFPTEQLRELHLYSEHGRSYMRLLPEHALGERTGLAPYTVEFPQGAVPRPYEVAQALVVKHPGIKVDKIGITKT
ncbi:hypothetical protein [Corynebacterium kozikiae]|uniref:hypothetical protein n=1 Tax=Corynebacterium kozikiae TaxID=2968469 RepID=UPI00211B8652|nr:hypothetical protein [Corynebacterium sp. 76QC2CO]MCQ9343191.1 hypothetical protein [Corynebacterium sp. 76QC2CO]